MPSGSSKDSLLLELPAAGPVGGGIHYIFWKGFDPKSGKFQCPTPAFWADADDPPCKKDA
ncbi:hypothetical protein JKG47_08545 [Acidithiobacillus sp. MC6.1]|nr:hypothetical protein [Acidithiobacillus sp. MC6.1]